jgi:hypothetical protein
VTRSRDCLFTAVSPHYATTAAAIQKTRPNLTYLIKTPARKYMTKTYHKIGSPLLAMAALLVTSGVRTADLSKVPQTYEKTQQRDERME